MLEKSFILNACVTSSTILYIGEQDTNSVAIIITTSLAIALLQLIGITFGHILWQIKKWRKGKQGLHGGQLAAIIVNHDDQDYREPLLSSGNHDQ